MRFLGLIVALAAPQAHADVFGFETPSGNIQCWVGLELNHADISCTIVERSGPPAAPRPVGCSASWGHVFTMSDFGPVLMECAPAPGRVQMFDTAPYGQTGQFNQITCQSERTGFECRNADGLGFFLSRRQQLVF